MQMLMLPGRFSENREYDASYWIPNKDAIAKVMAQNFGLESENAKQASEPSALKVAIQDSTGSDRSHLRPLIRSLEKAGYRNVYIAKAWGEPLEVTHIVAQQGDEESAQSIRDTLGFGEVRVESTGNISSDISIQVGKDWVQQKAILEKSNTP
jgi:hypothetical protein